MILQIMDINMENNEQEHSVKHSDFSIDHILNRAGSTIAKNSEETVCCDRIVGDSVEKFDWLQCSRYCPPKVPRLHKKDVQKRQLGRHPRIPFTSHQLSILEQKFRESPYLSSEDVIVLSRKLQLADIRVKIWFQNRRARERREKNGVFGENKMTEDKKNVSEETLKKCNFFSLGLEIDRGNDMKMPKHKKHSIIKSEEITAGLNGSKNSTLIKPHSVDDIFNNSGVSSPYLLPNGILGQNVPFFIPFVNFSHSPSQDSKS